MELIQTIGKGPIALDTPIFIHFIEEHPAYLPLIAPLFIGIDQGLWDAVTSGVTLLETLVVPFRAGNLALADRYEQLLTHSRGLTVVPADHRAAAQLRARYDLRTPDALQLAAALATACTAFVTTGRRLPAIRGIRIVDLETCRAA